MTEDFYGTAQWYREGRGPRYQQLRRHIAAAIGAGELTPGEHLPPERDLAERAGVSRVTVRKAVAQLVAEGLVEQRQGAGSFVRAPAERLQQSLSSLVSFTETMQARGIVSTSRILDRGIFTPHPAEIVGLGLSPQEKVARIERLRSAGETPIALERSSLPRDILPRPEAVQQSLYEVLRRDGTAPTRALQRVTAENLSAEDAALLRLPEGAAALRIVRTAYLASGRPVELTSGLYRSDIYDFVSELRLD